MDRSARNKLLDSEGRFMDQTPPLLPELEGWAIVQANQVGPPASAGVGRSQRLVARSCGSHLEVVYRNQVDQREDAEQVIAETINLMVMAGNASVLRKGESARIDLDVGEPRTG